jgi:opacity protein-like surface antigen
MAGDMTNSHARIPVLLMAAVAAFATLALGAASAQAAATLKLSCVGKGAKNEDSAGTVLCAADPGKKRSIKGTIRNDAGQPVAGKVTVTYSSWTIAPNGIGYNVKPTSTKEVVAGADGTFTISSNTTTRESIKVDLVPDTALGISSAPSAAAEVQRRLGITVKKLGGGSVQVTVKGTSIRPLKVSITDPNGYYVPGIPKAKKANAKGQATFNLGNRTGKFGYYVDAGDYSDLFWPQNRSASFKL